MDGWVGGWVSRSVRGRNLKGGKKKLQITGGGKYCIILSPPTPLLTS